MKFGDIAKKAKQTFEDRGGTDALKQDAEELKNIAKGQGSLSDKAKQAAEALKDPGAAGEDPAPDSAPGAAGEDPAPDSAPGAAGEEPARDATPGA